MRFKLDESELMEMANVSTQDTGLPYSIWIDSAGKDRKTSHNDPRIKVRVNGEFIPVSISKNPEILVERKFDHSAEVLKWVRKYYDVLIKHWNKELTDKQALNLLGR